MFWFNERIGSISLSSNDVFLDSTGWHLRVSFWPRQDPLEGEFLFKFNLHIGWTSETGLMHVEGIPRTLQHPRHGCYYSYWWTGRKPRKFWPLRASWIVI